MPAMNQEAPPAEADTRWRITARARGQRLGRQSVGLFAAVGLELAAVPSLFLGLIVLGAEPARGAVGVSLLAGCGTLLVGGLLAFGHLHGEFLLMFHVERKSPASQQLAGLPGTIIPLYMNASLLLQPRQGVAAQDLLTDSCLRFSVDLLTGRNNAPQPPRAPIAIQRGNPVHPSPLFSPRHLELTQVLDWPSGAIRPQRIARCRVLIPLGSGDRTKRIEKMGLSGILHCHGNL